MNKKLYLITVNQISHHYVQCPSEDLDNWRNLLIWLGCYEEVNITEIELTDFDEITHIHFC